MTARVWDARTGAELAKLEGRIGPVMSVAVPPGGRIVIGSDDMTARVPSYVLARSSHGSNVAVQRR